MTFSYEDISEDHPPDVLKLYQDHGQEGFDRLVLDGISASINLSYVRGSGVKSTYYGRPTGKISRLAARRLAARWKEDPRPFMDLYPGTIVDAIKEFLEDDEKDSQEAERVLRLSEKDQLPPLPEGYDWNGDNGGIRWFHNRLYLGCGIVNLAICQCQNDVE